ncbi:hypothetical protein D3C78_815870 [compost metagenome]
MLFDLGQSSAIDQRTLLGFTVQGAADAHGGNRFDELAGEGFVHAVLNEEAIYTNAGLPGVTELRGHGAFDRRIQIGVVEHDERRVAAQLQRDLFQGVGGLAHQQFAGAGRTGERQLAHDAGRLQCAANRHGITGDDVEHTGRNPCLLGQHRQGESRQGGFFRRFEDHRATGGQRRADLAGDHGQREVPRGDRRDHTDGFLGDDDPRIGLVARDHVAIGALGFFGEPLQEARCIDHFAHGFGQRLTLFAAEQHGQVLLVAQHQVAPALEALAAFLGGQLAPRRQGTVGRFDGQIGLFSASLLHFGDQLAVGRVQHRVCGATAGPLAIDETSVTDQRAHATASVRLKRSRPGRAVRRIRLPAV